MMAGDFFRLPDRKDVILSNLFDASSPNTAKESPRISLARPKFLKQKMMAASDGTALTSLCVSRKRESAAFPASFLESEYNFMTAKVIPPIRITAVAISMVSVFLFISYIGKYTQYY